MTGADAGKSRIDIPLSSAAWSVDLSRYGFRREDNALQRIRGYYYLTDSSFLNDGDTIETFESRELVEALEKRDDPKRPLPYRLNAVVLDSATGELGRKLDWPSEYKKIGIVPRIGGGFSVFLGDHIEFYSSNLEKQSELKLPALAGGDDALQGFSASPSGNTMLVMYGASNPTHCVVVIGEVIAADLTKCSLPARTFTSDDEFVAFTPSPAGDSGQVLIEKFKGPWRALCGNWDCNEPEFVAEDRLVVWSRMGLTLIRNDGKLIFETQHAVKQGGIYVRGYSRKRGLWAFPYFQDIYDPDSPQSKSLQGIMVYNVAIVPPDPALRNRPGVQLPFLVFTVKNGGKNRIRNLQGLAISPNGDRLALEGDGILRCFNLPPKQWWE